MQNIEELPVQLPGKGYVRKVSGNYLPGEYAELTNVVISPEGSLVKRPSVQASNMGDTVLMDKCLGNIGNNTLFTRFDPAIKGDHLFALRPNNLGVVEITQPASSMDPTTIHALLEAEDTFNAAYVGTDRSYGFLDCFRYGMNDYFLTWHSARGNSGSLKTWSHFQLHMLYFPNAFGTDTTYSDDVIGGFLTCSDPLPIWNEGGGKWFNLSDEMYADPSKIKISTLIHKDRVYVSFEDTVYFSKAGDPTLWTVADGGGFVKFPEISINKIIALGDIIYIIGDNTVHAFSYSTDPNEDAQTTLVSDNMGAEDAVIYNDSIILADQNNLYSLNGFNISKLADLDLGFRYLSGSLTLGDTVSNFGHNIKIGIFEDRLYILSRQVKYANTVSYTALATKYVPDLSHPCYYSMSLEDGHMSVFKYDIPNYYPVIPVDFIVNPVQDKFNQSRLVTLGMSDALDRVQVFWSGPNQLPPTNIDGSSTYLPAETNVDVFSTSTPANPFTFAPIQVKIVIKDISPEGLKYYKSKFRSIQLLADLPMFPTVTDIVGDTAPSDPELELIIEAGLATDNSWSNYPRPELRTALTQVLTGTHNSETTSHGAVAGYRYGINQKASTVDIIIQTRAAAKVAYTLNIINTYANHEFFFTYSRMEIVDIRLLVTPTRRGITGNANDRS